MTGPRHALPSGRGDGLAHWPREIATLRRLGRENLDATGRELDGLGVDRGSERAGELTVATRPHEVDELLAAVDQDVAYGGRSVFLGRDAARAGRSGVSVRTGWGRAARTARRPRGSRA